MNLKELLFTDVKELRKQKQEKAEAPAPEPVETPKVDEVVAEEPRTVEPAAMTPATEEPAKPKAPRVRKPKTPRVRKPKLDLSRLLPPKPDANAAKSTPAKSPKSPKPSRIKAPRFSAPEIKLPPAVSGVVESLRERGLLPVALLLVAAIVAVPFLLSGGSSSPAPNSEPKAAATDEAIETQQAVVLANNPGVREYKKRLRGSPKDPFVQQYQVPESGGGGATTGVEQVGGSPGVEPTGDAAAGGTTDTGGDTPAGSPVFYYAADLFVSREGKSWKVWKDVKRGATLPNKNVRAVAFLGVPIDKPSVAEFVISDDVVDISGDGKCDLGTNVCELIRIKTGSVFKFTLADGRTFAVKLAATYPINTKISPTG